MVGITRKRVKNCAFRVALFLAANCAFGQRQISSLQARNHIGEYSKVCGMVPSTHFANRSRGAPTFINLDQPYPHQVFTAVIWWKTALNSVLQNSASQVGKFARAA
jgi:hypothetical protein